MLKEDHARALGNRLRQLRREASLTQVALAEKADISTVYVNKIERGLATPSVHVLHRLAQCLNTEVSSLLSTAGELEAPQGDGSSTSPYLSLFLPETKTRARNLVFDTTDEPIPVPSSTDDNAE
jgi:transcriptional regulator with XRE-family HTH domain